MLSTSRTLPGLTIALLLGSALLRTAGASQLPQLFSETSVLQMELTSDFQNIQADAQVLQNDPEDPALKLYTAAKISVAGGPTFSAQVRARGNSSLSDNSFPKLKIKIDKKQNLLGSPFEHATSFRVNTHVSTYPKSNRTEYGRYNGEEAPWRESLAYDLARVLDLTTPGTRKARIKYIDIKTGETFTRNALLIETDDSVAKRLGATFIDSMNFGKEDQSGIDAVLGARFHLFHKLLGNEDVCLRVNEEPMPMTEIYRPLWNASVLRLPSGQRLPLVYDLDLAGIGIEMKPASPTKT